MKSVKIIPSKLRGEILVPPSKSISHRHLIGASLAKGESVLRNISYSDDLDATLVGIRALGAEADYFPGGADLKARDVAVVGSGFPRLLDDVIDCGESASTLRFLIPLAAVAGGQVTFTGEGGLGQRPLEPYYRIFDEQGIEYVAEGGGLPLTISGGLRAGQFSVRGDISSQFITGLLFALPLLEGDSEIAITTPLESKGYVDLTLDALEGFSVYVTNRGYEHFYIPGGQRYRPGVYDIEGDYSQGAFWIASGALGGHVRCQGLKPHSRQGDMRILDILHSMGAAPSVGSNYVEMGPSDTVGTTVDVSQCPDLVPVLAVLGALSRGRTQIVRAERLRIKESDRLEAMASELTKLGADIEQTPDGLVMTGKRTLQGGVVDSWGDHRIAMAMAIAAMRCEGPVTIERSDAVSKSYPAFWEDYIEVGGILHECDFRR